MNTEVKIAKHVIQDKLEAQVKTAEARLDTLKARAQSAKANLETAAIAELLARKTGIRQKLQELKTMGEERWEKAKADIERLITEFDKAVNQIETKLKAH